LIALGRHMKEDINIPGLSETCLKNNLMALALRSPELCQWIQTLPDKEALQLQVTASGHPNVVIKELLLHSPIDPAKEAEEEVRKLRFGYHQPTLCLGVGLGYYVEALLKRSNPCQPVAAYERNPWLLVLTLMRSDFRRDILAGRLKFLSSADILRSRREDRQGFFLWPHPVLGPIYEWEKALFTRQEATAGSYERALVIAGGLFVVDVSDALQEKGLEVHSWNPPTGDQQHIVKDILSYDPHLIVSVNYRHGLSEISSSLGIPLLVWEIDPSIERLAPQPTGNPYTYIYTYRKSNVSRFREAGFKHVEYLPLATNPRRRFPMDLTHGEIEQYGADVSFAGSSMADQAEVLRQLFARMTERRGFSANPSSPIRDYARLWDLALQKQKQNPDRYVVEEVFKEHLPQGSWVTGDGEHRLVDLAACTAETTASQRRAQALSTLSQLGDGARVRVWGDGGWRRFLPETIHYSGPVGHFHELTAVYNASRVNLDINRIYQRDIVTMRVFDVLACRGFLLADHSNDLEELFDLNSELIAYRSLAEIPSLVKHFLCHPNECQQIAMAGHQRVLKEHTIQLRIERMLDNLP
jgi:spore maturation protein CgeB